MNKKILIFALLLSVSLFLGSCEYLDQIPTTDPNYEIWKNSEDAYDLDGDKKINESDYEIYQLLNDYDYWKNSDVAEDLNSDRKIDEADYEIYQLYNNYDYWKNSDEAEDLNEDRVINAADFEIYKLHNDYDYWKNSDEAEDLNDDSVIDESDFELYQTPSTLTNYEIWQNSEEAEDLNDDTIINEADYQIYLEFAEFSGNYVISNYIYDGSADYAFENGLRFLDLGLYVTQMTIIIDNKGDISVTLPSNIITNLGDLYIIIVEGANNMSIARISPYIVGIDTDVTIDDIIVNFTLYLTETENGFSASYVIGFYLDNPVITFDITKVE